MSDLKKLKEELCDCLNEKKEQLIETLQKDEISIDKFRFQSIEVSELIIQINFIDVLIEQYSELEDVKKLLNKEK